MKPEEIFNLPKEVVLTSLRMHEGDRVVNELEELLRMSAREELKGQTAMEEAIEERVLHGLRARLAVLLAKVP